MQARAALIFLMSFLLLLRAASAHSWASVGAPLTAYAFTGAVLLAAALAGSWIAYQVAHRPAAIRHRHGHHHGRLLIAR